MRDNLRFGQSGTSGSGLTKIWSVMPIAENLVLGRVSWYAPWRRYCFFPIDGSLYDPSCLREIADFCEIETLNQKRNQTGIKGS